MEAKMQVKIYDQKGGNAGTIDLPEKVFGMKEVSHYHKDGVYVLEVINGGGDLVKEIDRRLKVIDAIVRHMIVRVDEETKVVERTRTRRQTSSERRRVRRGLPPVRQPGEGRSTETDEAEDDRFDGVEV
jgi:ribosomal protein S6